MQLENKTTRKDINRLMTIPEVREIVEAKFAELSLIFKRQLKEMEESEKQRDVVDINSAKHPSTSILDDGANPGGKPGKNIVQIVDACRYRDEDEEKQIKVFLNYFYSHKGLRQVILEDFYLRILPYSNILLVEN